MPDLTQYITTKYNKMISELIADLGATSDSLDEALNIIRALKNPDMLVNGTSNLTLDRVQIMENGDIRVMPPAPAPITETCVKEPEKNGKKDAKDLINVS